MKKKIIVTTDTREGCPGCKFFKLKSYHSVKLPYCTSFETYLEFYERKKKNWIIVTPCCDCEACEREKSSQKRKNVTSDEGRFNPFTGKMEKYNPLTGKMEEYNPFGKPEVVEYGSP